jgi:flagellar protein FlbD
MITVTRLNNQPVVINADLIKFIEQTPDTLITLTTGERVMVRESLQEVVARAIQYGRQVRAFWSVPADQTTAPAASAER